MKMEIYQINLERDRDCVGFLDRETLQKFQGSGRINSSIYDKVYEGEIPCTDLEEVYQIFNLHHPKGYSGRSLSVSDVIRTEGSPDVPDGFYFCDSMGFEPVSFDPSQTRDAGRPGEKRAAEKLSVLLVRPGRSPKMIEIEDSLEAMQEVVGGDIEEYMPFSDDIAIICNEEGKMNRMPLNRAVYGEDGELIDIIAGDFFLTCAPADSSGFCSMPKEMAEKYQQLFQYPERFVQTDTGIMAVPYKPVRAERDR